MASSGGLIAPRRASFLVMRGTPITESALRATQSLEAITVRETAKAQSDFNEQVIPDARHVPRRQDFASVAQAAKMSRHRVRPKPAGIDRFT